jgi:CARDB
MRRSRVSTAVLASVVLLALVPSGAAMASSAPVGAPNLSPVWWSYFDDCAFQLIDVGVGNFGTAEAGPFAIAARVDGRPYGIVTYDQVLPPRGTASVGPWPLVQVTPGTHRVDFLIDARRQVAESDESDNHRSFEITCA